MVVVVVTCGASVMWQMRGGRPEMIVGQFRFWLIDALSHRAVREVLALEY